MKLLIYVGVDTVNLKSEDFTLLVKGGEQVKKSQKLIVPDIAKIKAAGYLVTTAVLVTNSDDYVSYKMADGPVMTVDELITVEL